MAGISQLAADAAPAGAPASGETLFATAGALVISAGMLAIVAGHRAGRLRLMQRAADAVTVTGWQGGWSVVRTFVLDEENLQREQKAGVSGALVLGAYLTVLIIWLGLLAALAWGLARCARTTDGDRPPLAKSITTERIAA